ncbi:MAG TPA: SprT-like domain-containing protein [Gemmatimonadaceae bacterium]|nr:SprT-like domain-containing protein [Gemmatimonadaceae bacterium]
MFRALLARVGLSGLADQLELGLGIERATPGAPVAGSGNATGDAGGVAPLRTGRRPLPHHEAGPLLERLRAFGMSGITTLHLTRNRTTLVSFRSGTLRVQEAFTRAPDDVLRAIAVFVSARGAARAAAKRTIVAYPIERGAPARPPRRTPLHPDDRAMADRLRREHARLNTHHFGGALQPITVTVSRRMKSRLGHYAPARAHPHGAEIAISRRHIRRHGWADAIDTLLHEMVHQWQEESGLPVDHGPAFRRKAAAVGTTPRAKRALR